MTPNNKKKEKRKRAASCALIDTRRGRRRTNRRTGRLVLPSKVFFFPFSLYNLDSRGHYTYRMTTERERERENGRLLTRLLGRGRVHKNHENNHEFNKFMARKKKTRKAAAIPKRQTRVEPQHATAAPWNAHAACRVRSMSCAQRVVYAACRVRSTACRVRTLRIVCEHCVSCASTSSCVRALCIVICVRALF